MISPFGVDHGEVSKGLGMPKLPSMGRIGSGVSNLGGKIGSGTQRLGQKAGAFGGGQLRQGRLKTAGISGSLGNRMRGAGNSMLRNKTATGVGALGVGGVAGTAGIASANKPKRQF